MAAVQMDVRFARSSKLKPEVNVSKKVERCFELRRLAAVALEQSTEPFFATNLRNRN